MPHDVPKPSTMQSPPDADTSGISPAPVPATPGIPVAPDAAHDDTLAMRTTPQAAPAAPQESARSARPFVAWQWLKRNTFAPRWLPDRWCQPLVGYVVAVLVQLIAVLVTALLLVASARFAFACALVLLGVLLVALNWGAGPSIAAAVVGALLIDFVALPPQLAWVPVSFWDSVALVLLLGVGLVISLLISSVERSRRQAEEERTEAQLRVRALQQVQARMDEFVAVASHDLRSPLMTALGFNTLAAQHYEQLASAVVPIQPGLAGRVERVRTDLQEAGQSVERLQRLVNRLFDTTQVRAGTLDLHRMRCDLAAVVQDHVQALRIAHPRRTLQLEMICEQPVPVEADADRIGQVVTNYVTNALKYSTEDQPVVVRVRRHDGTRAQVLVEDRGPGLPTTEQAHIWERFYRVERVRAQSSGSGYGLGLGLHISKAIVERHGGTVGVESTGGHGSTFWFTLPLAEESG